MSFVQPLRQTVARLLDAFYPPVCAVCQRLSTLESYLCEACEGELAKLEQTPACPSCGSPLAQSGAPCPWCLGKGIRPFVQVYRLATFDEPLKTLIHHIKYHGQWHLAEILADRMLKSARLGEALAHIDAIVPVPLHYRRQFSRGYNQAQVLAAHLSKRCGARLRKPVIRIRDTPTQTLLPSQQARLENVRHAFALARTRGLQDKHILLVDDVMTSGATLQAVARCILPAKPASISALALAVADPRRRGFTRV